MASHFPSLSDNSARLKGHRFDGGGTSKNQYASKYNTSAKNVTVDKKPQSCNFFCAPICKKGCSYRANAVATIRSKDVKTGRSIISNDDRKTWDWDDDGAEPLGVTVYVSWERVQE